MDPGPIGLLLLAAGEASRMGRPKQLLHWRGETFLARAIREAETSRLGPLGVVTGAWREEVEVELARLDASFSPFYNPDWSAGMGSSIRRGVADLTRMHADLDAVLIFLVDQVYVTRQHLNELARLWRRNPEKIAAARYGDQAGVPAIFPPSLFPTLTTLPPAIGARKVLRQAGEALVMLDMPQGALDIDTPADYRRLLDGDHF